MADGSKAAANKIKLRGIRYYIIIGMFGVLGLFGGMLFWSAAAELQGAVVGAGVVGVSSKTKEVQHLEGGIIGKIYSRDGDYVKAGEVVIRLDDKLDRSNLSITVNRIYEFAAQKSRLEAERDKADSIIFPDILTHNKSKETYRIMEGQEKLFSARVQTRNGQIEQLKKRVTQLNDSINGIESLKKSKKKQVILINKELRGLRKLYKDGHTTLTRVLALERQAARLDGEIAEHQSELARTKNAIGETELKIIEIDHEAREKILSELREVDAKLAELKEQENILEEKLRRIDIKAPVSGVIYGMTVHTEGGVVTPAEVLLYIVPSLSNNLVVETRINPQDVDQLYVGQDARVRFEAFNRKTTPELYGKIGKISADRFVDKNTGQAYYEADVEFNDEELKRLGKSELVPGMPATVMIATKERTVLNYLIKPLSDQIYKAFREE